VSVVCCQVEVSLRRADQSSKGFLPNVVCLSVWSKNLVNEEAMAPGGLLGQKNKQRNKNIYISVLPNITLMSDIVHALRVLFYFKLA